MTKPEIRQHLDYAYRLLREEVERAQELGTEAEGVLQALQEEERLPKGLRDALIEARKHYAEGAATLSRVLEGHLGGVREHAAQPVIAMYTEEMFGDAVGFERKVEGA